MNDVLIAYATLFGPLVGVLIGFLLSQYSNRYATKEAKLSEFKKKLTLYHRGKTGEVELRIAYAELPDKFRKRVSIEPVMECKPDERIREVMLLLRRI